eukprot:98674-Amphidinium_carterae.1
MASMCTGLGTHHYALQVCCVHEMLSCVMGVRTRLRVVRGVYNFYSCHVAQEIDLVSFTDVYGCDPKKASQAFCRRGLHVQHLFETISSMTSNYGQAAKCVLHGGLCPIPTMTIDILAAGFPCSPYSGQRPGRHSKQRPACKQQVHVAC